jgi:hypothetical protein
LPDRNLFASTAYQFLTVKAVRIDRLLSRQPFKASQEAAIIVLVCLKRDPTFLTRVIPTNGSAAKALYQQTALNDM